MNENQCTLCVGPFLKLESRVREITKNYVYNLSNEVHCYLSTAICHLRLWPIKHIPIYISQYLYTLDIVWKLYCKLSKIRQILGGNKIITEDVPLAALLAAMLLFPEFDDISDNVGKVT